MALPVVDIYPDVAHQHRGAIRYHLIYGWNQYLWRADDKDVFLLHRHHGIQRMARASDFQPQCTSSWRRDTGLAAT